MTALNDLTITAALAGLDKGDFSARELTEVHLSAMALQHGLNAFITETPDKARAMAAASDERRREGKVGLLEGIPLGIKDLFCTEGVLTTAGSHILDGFKPPYESSVTARLWQVPQPMRGDPERIKLWAQVITGLEVDELTAVHVLDAATWQQRRQRLEKLGGPPLAEK